MWIRQNVWFTSDLHLPRTNSPHRIFVYTGPVELIQSVPVAARSKAWVCGRSPAEIVGSNPTGDHGCMSVASVVCCQVEVSATS